MTPHELNLKVALELAKASEQRAWNVVEIIRSARKHETEAIQAMSNALRDANPLLVHLGDFTGNANGRCEVILKAKEALRSFEACMTSEAKPETHEAKLLAAAPDLLQAAEQSSTRIQRVLKDPKINPNHVVVLDMALVGLKAAISKVRE